MDPHICPCIQTITILVLGDRYEENPVSLSYIAGEGRSILIAFSDSYGYSF